MLDAAQLAELNLIYAGPTTDGMHMCIDKPAPAAPAAAASSPDSRVIVTTTLGRFVLDSDGKIERGKLLKESLHGCYTSRRASE